MNRHRALGSVFVVALALAACKRGAEPADTHATAAAPEAPPASGAQAPLVLAPTNQIRWMQAPEGISDVAAAVQKARAEALSEKRTLVVYVGATWCEPCQRFHHAVERGELDAAFPSLSVLAFDVDRDGEPLATAGYVSRLIPLFALPLPDGRASGKAIEGSVKGEQAASEITPRLRALLAQAM